MPTRVVDSALHRAAAKPWSLKTPIFSQIPWRQRYNISVLVAASCVRKISCWGSQKFLPPKKNVPRVPGHKTSKFLGKDLVRNRVPTRLPGVLPGKFGDRWVEEMGLGLGGQILVSVGFGGQGQNARLTLDLRYLTQLPRHQDESFFFSKGEFPFW